MRTQHAFRFPSVEGPSQRHLPQNIADYILNSQVIICNHVHYMTNQPPKYNRFYFGKQRSAWKIDAQGWYQYAPSLSCFCGKQSRFYFGDDGRERLREKGSWLRINADSSESIASTPKYRSSIFCPKRSVHDDMLIL
jgi:hypothetical protein